MKTLKKILSLLLVCALLATAVPALAEGAALRDDAARFGGYAVHDFGDNIFNKFIGFSASDPAEVEVHSFCLTTYAAAYYDGIVYGYLFGYDDAGTLHDEFYTMDTRNNYLMDYHGSSDGEFVYAMAYNYADDTMYALCDEDHPYLASVDLETGALTRVVDIELASYLALRGMAVSPSGEFYFLTMAAVSSRLVRLDTETGALSEIGSTGLPAFYACSMTCDPATGMFYWAQFDGYNSNGLYAIDPQTAECTLLGHIGGIGMEITGLYVVYDEEPSQPHYTLGDVDNDGDIDMMDALLAMRASMGLIELSQTGELAADVDSSGSVTAMDALRILRCSMGIDEL